MDFLSAASFIEPRRLSDGRVVLQRKRGLAVVIDDAAMERRVRRRLGLAILLPAVSLPGVLLLTRGFGALAGIALTAGAGGLIALLAMRWAFSSLPLRNIPRDATFAPRAHPPDLDAYLACYLTAFCAGTALAGVIRFALGREDALTVLAFGVVALAASALVSWAVLRRKPERSLFQEQTPEGHLVG